jgi:hypothetical protein
MLPTGSIIYPQVINRIFAKSKFGINLGYLGIAMVAIVW